MAIKRTFQISLINVPFSDTYDNVIYFKDKEERIEYFKNVYKVSFDNSPLVNFNFGDGLNCECVINDNTYNGSNFQSSVTSHNYCIVRETLIVNGTTTYDDRFYFIKECKYITATQIQLKLKLDIFTTYMISQYMTNVNVYADIQRACLNRYKKVDSYYCYNFDADSLLLEKEDLSFNKRLVDSHKLTIKQNFNNGTLNSFLEEAVDYYACFFVDPNKQLQFYAHKINNVSEGKIADIFNNVTYLNIKNNFSNFHFIWIPILKSGYSITVLFKYNNSSVFSQNVYKGDLVEVLNYFKGQNLTPYIIDARYTKWPLFSDYAGDVTVSGKQVLLSCRISAAEADYYSPDGIMGSGLSCASIQNNRCVFMGYTASVDLLTLTYTTNKYKNQRSFLLNEAINNYNPKSLSDSVKHFVLRNGSSSYTYNWDYLGTFTPNVYLEYNYNFNYKEALIPSISRSYLYLDTMGLYVEGTTLNYTGVVNNADMSIIYYNDQYSNYIANNKNAWLQTTFKIGSSAVSSGVKTATNLSNTGHLGTGLITSGISAVNGIIQYNLNLDNMKAAPQSINNVQGNFYLNDLINNNDIYLEEWEALPTDIQKFNDYCSRFGYKVGRLGSLKDYINIRKYWNYIQAYIEVIPQSIYKFNYKIENEIKNAFANGIRFWNVIDTSTEVEYNFNKNNYEKYLDDES